MSYQDFSFPGVVKQFGLEAEEGSGLFAGIEPAPVSPWLREGLAETLPLATAISTEKARSEMLIAPILIEVRKLLQHRVSLFSGVNFPVDPPRGLTGLCNYLFSRSREQLFIKAPVLLVAEAKNEDIKGGIGQCLAEMVAAQIWNAREEVPAAPIFGAVSTGEIWRFLELSGTKVKIDLTGYKIDDVGKILGILRSMLNGDVLLEGSTQTP